MFYEFMQTLVHGSGFAVANVVFKILYLFCEHIMLLHYAHSPVVEKGM